MDAHLLPPQLKRFVESSIDSFEKLEIVRVLWHAPESSWTVERLAERVGTFDHHIGPALTELIASGLIVPGPARREYVAAAHSPHAASVAALLRLYDDDPLAIMRVINDLALRRIRGMAARTFADAFLVKTPRKPETDDG